MCCFAFVFYFLLFLNTVGSEEVYARPECDAVRASGDTSPPSRASRATSFARGLSLLLLVVVVVVVVVVLSLLVLLLVSSVVLLRLLASLIVSLLLLSLLSLLLLVVVSLLRTKRALTSTEARECSSRHPPIQRTPIPQQLYCIYIHTYTYIHIYIYIYIYIHICLFIYALLLYMTSISSIVICVITIVVWYSLV